jgi:hypothetical protein
MTRRVVAVARRLLAAGGLAAALLACATPPPDQATRGPAPGAGISSGTPDPPATYGTDTPVGEIAGVLVIAARGTYRAGCRPELIARVAARFTAAVAADPPAALVLAAPRFAAYSMAERATGRLVVAHDRPALADLLHARAARHERQRLIALLVKPEGHLEYAGLRAADDAPAEPGVTLGKGKVDCAAAAVEVLNGVDEGDAARLLDRPGSLPASWLPIGLAEHARPVVDAPRAAS